MKDIVNQFRLAIQKQRLSHLYLLAGSKGTHKKKLARELAYEIFKHENDYPALKHQLESDNHPNLIYIPLDGQSIKKEQIIALQKEFSKTSLVSGSRVYIIENVELMSLSAANSLLKFMEEPKDNQTIGFLLTDDVNAVISTIISRSQVIIVEDDENHFNEELKAHDIEDKDRMLLYFLTKDLEEAFHLYENDMYQNAVAKIDAWINWFINPVQPLSLFMVDLASMFGVDKSWLVFMFEVMSQLFLDVIHLHMNQKVILIYYKDKIMDLVRRYDVKTCESILKALHETLKDLTVPVNVPLALQALAVTLGRVRG